MQSMRSLRSIFNQIKRQFGPAILSPEWLAKHATPISLPEYHHGLGTTGKRIYHVTDKESAALIIESRLIWGIDVVSSAHFHHRPELAERQANGRFVCGFRWDGPTRDVVWANNLTSHYDRTPNVLFDVPVADGESTWELRLYPGTDQVVLEYVQLCVSEPVGFLLNKPLRLKVIPA